MVEATDIGGDSVVPRRDKQLDAVIAKIKQINSVILTFIMYIRRLFWLFLGTGCIFVRWRISFFKFRLVSLVAS